MKTKLSSSEIESFGKKLEGIFARYGHFVVVIGSYDSDDNSIIFKIKFANPENVYVLLLNHHYAIMTAAGGREMDFRLKDGFVELQFERPVVKLNS